MLSSFWFFYISNWVFILNEFDKCHVMTVLKIVDVKFLEITKKHIRDGVWL